MFLKTYPEILKQSILVLITYHLNWGFFFTKKTSPENKKPIYLSASIINYDPFQLFLVPSFPEMSNNYIY